jgi:ADP-ribose pyrophosphatase YjhB (NUDIX family)
MSVNPCFYRLTAKCVIRNPAGHVLLIREASGDWGLPGGGIEHGEDIATGLARELHEELGVGTPDALRLVGAHPYFSTSRQNWWLWLVYEAEVTLPEQFKGELAAGAAFVDIQSFKGSSLKAEQRIYETLRT